MRNELWVMLWVGDVRQWTSATFRSHVGMNWNQRVVPTSHRWRSGCVVMYFPRCAFILQAKKHSYQR